MEELFSTEGSVSSLECAIGPEGTLCCGGKERTLAQGLLFL